MEENYKCECCNIEFIDYSLGVDIYIGNNWLISEPKMVDDMWYWYLDNTSLYKTWGNLKKHICDMKELKNEDYPVWLHLYNRYISMSAPDDSILYCEFIN